MKSYFCCCLLFAAVATPSAACETLSLGVCAQRQVAVERFVEPVHVQRQVAVERFVEPVHVQRQVVLQKQRIVAPDVETRTVVRQRVRPVRRIRSRSVTKSVVR